MFFTADGEKQKKREVRGTTSLGFPVGKTEKKGVCGDALCGDASSLAALI